jgi:hypothetical protein
VDGVVTMPVTIGIVLVMGLGVVYGWRAWQRCPHCGRLVQRVARGWKRCGHCGRQYRRGLRVR